MLDKLTIKKRFARSMKTYNENALVQKKMAVKLINMLPLQDYNSVFEIGCATGILTQEIKKYINFNQFSANDIVEDCKKYIDEIIIPNNFITGDIEEIELTNKYDLIISNACLQWCSNTEAVISKLFDNLNDNGILAFSVFGNENLKEIKKVFDIKNSICEFEALKKFLVKYNCETIEEEIFKLEFENLKEVLKHLKFTGVNSVKNVKLTKNSLKNLELKYKELYSQNEKVTLTYNPVYIIIKKS